MQHDHPRTHGFEAIHHMQDGRVQDTVKTEWHAYLASCIGQRLRNINRHITPEMFIIKGKHTLVHDGHTLAPSVGPAHGRSNMAVWGIHTWAMPSLMAPCCSLKTVADRRVCARWMAAKIHIRPTTPASSSAPPCVTFTSTDSVDSMCWANR